MDAAHQAREIIAKQYSACTEGLYPTNLNAVSLETTEETREKLVEAYFSAIEALVR